jgi:hypothetical protein
MDLLLKQRYERVRNVDYKKAKEIGGEISYSEAVAMFLDISALIHHKQLENETPISIPLKSIRMSDDGIYIAEFKQLFHLKDGVIYVEQPYKKYDGDAPEVKIQDSLPAKFTSSVPYYSLCNSILEAMQLDNKSEIHGTKLFYALQRILDRDPSERFVLFI